MKKRTGLVIMVALVVATCAVALFAQAPRRNEFIEDPRFPQNKAQPYLISDLVSVAHMVPVGAGHGATWEPQWAAMRILYTKDRKACWIGNRDEPHNWTPAPAEVCR